MIPQPAASTSPFRQSPSPHLHIYSETCPWCEQDIPPEKLEEISGKIAAREREQADAITAKLEQQYTIDKAQADAKAKADLELERQYSAARETAAREEARKAAEAAAAEKLAEAERSRQEMQAGLQQQVAQAEAARVAAEQTGASLQTQLQRLRQDSEAALAAAKAEANAKEGEIHAEAQQAAEAAMAEKLAASEKRTRGVRSHVAGTDHGSRDDKGCGGAERRGAARATACATAGHRSRTHQIEGGRGGRSDPYPPGGDRHD